MTTERTTADLLSTLNTLRAITGKAPLTSWKASRADLLERIEQLTPASNLSAPKTPAAPAPDLAAAIAAAEVPVTVIPASAPELTKPATRKAAIAKIVNTAVTTDTPTTVVGVNQAARSLRKEASDATKLSKLGKVTTKTETKKLKDRPAVKVTTKTTTTPAVNELGAYLATINMDAKIARAKLRRAGFSAPYTITAELKAALAGDARKKAK